jgi:hypothetical protein
MLATLSLLVCLAGAPSVCHRMPVMQLPRDKCREMLELISELKPTDWKRPGQTLKAATCIVERRV